MPRADKQFELLYRERQPSSQNYDKVIFVKSKTPLEKPRGQTGKHLQHKKSTQKCPTDRKDKLPIPVLQSERNARKMGLRQGHGSETAHASSDTAHSSDTVQGEGKGKLHQTQRLQSPPPSKKGGSSTSRSKTRKKSVEVTSAVEEYVLLQEHFVPASRIQNYLHGVQPKQIEQETHRHLSEQPLHSVPALIDHLIEPRLAAAAAKLKAEEDLLRKVFDYAKITPALYASKLEAIRHEHRAQLIQIDKIRGILQANTAKTDNISRRTTERLEATERFGQFSDAQLQEIVRSVGEDLACPDSSEDEQQRDYPQARPVLLRESPNVRKTITLEEETDFYENSHFLRDVNSKMVGEAEALHEFKLSRQRLKQQIEARIGMQMGLLPSESGESGIDSSIIGIHRFITTFFKYYTFNYKNEFLRLINMPYGQPPLARIRAHQGYPAPLPDAYDDEEEDIIYGIEHVMRPATLQQFHRHYYSNDPSPPSKDYQKVHHQAIFDAFNQYLNFYRPYFLIGASPYPWDYSEKSLTFYFIAEDNIPEIFEKTQLKLLKASSSLCGLISNSDPITDTATADPITADTPCITPTQHLNPSEEIDLADAIDASNNALHPLLVETREERLLKLIKAETIEQQVLWELIEEHRTVVLLQIATGLYSCLLTEAARACRMPTRDSTVNDFML